MILRQQRLDLLVITLLPEQTFGWVDAHLVARKRQRHRAAAAVAKLKISAARAFCIFLAQRTVSWDNVFVETSRGINDLNNTAQTKYVDPETMPLSL